MDGIAAMLRRRAAFITAVTLACAGICLAWILLSAPKYVASGRILLDVPGAQVSSGGAAPAAGNADATGVENQIHVMTSRSVYDRVIAQEKLETDPLFGGKSKGILSALLAGVGLAPAVDRHAMALRQLDRAVSIVRNPGSHTVDVNVVTPDRETSARVANAVMDGYVEEQAQARKGVSPSAAASLGPRLETLQSRVRNAEQRYEMFRGENQTVVATGSSNAEKQMNEISGQMSAAEAKVAGLRSTLNQLQRARKTLEAGGIPDTARGGAVGALGNRYAAARQLELDLSETLGPRHPDLIIARMRANEAKRLLDQSIQGAVQSATSELERARSSVTQLRNRIEASKQDLMKSNETVARLKELERDVEASRVAYQAVLARSRDLGGQQQPDRSNARILSRATAPLEPSGAFPIGVLLTSLLIGLGLGVSLAWLLELMDEPKGPVTAP
ncbi:GumC family protein [Afipia massiliensis]|uniref:GumC family protein n=1 Tax=Afipia massiliensis TaxID=211460 RepID=UPI001FEEEE33|nr:GumC family protein [Afipia massiliensis]